MTNADSAPGLGQNLIHIGQAARALGIAKLATIHPYTSSKQKMECFLPGPILTHTADAYTSPVLKGHALDEKE